MRFPCTIPCPLDLPWPPSQQAWQPWDLPRPLCAPYSSPPLYLQSWRPAVTRDYQMRLLRTGPEEFKLPKTPEYSFRIGACTRRAKWLYRFPSVETGLPLTGRFLVLRKQVLNRSREITTPAKQAKVRVIVYLKRNSNQKSGHSPTVCKCWKNPLKGEALWHPRTIRRRTDEFHIYIPVVWKFSMGTLTVPHSVWPQSGQACAQRGGHKRPSPPPCQCLLSCPQAHFCSIVFTSYHTVNCWTLICHLHSPTSFSEKNSFFQCHVDGTWRYFKEDLWHVILWLRSTHANLNHTYIH